MSESFDVAGALRCLDPGRPLCVVDADEVLLRFVDGFDRFLRVHGLYLDMATYRLHGNVKRLEDDVGVLDVEVTALLDEFRNDLDTLEAVAGARESLRMLSARLDIVVLSNVNASQAVARRRNLDALELTFPLVCNSGAKGPAMREISERAGRPVFFVDDIPQHLASVAWTVPHAWLIHLVGDERLKPILPHSPHAHLRATSWGEASEFMRARLERAT